MRLRPSAPRVPRMGLFFAALLCNSVVAAAGDRLILITVDGLRPDAISPEATPAIDALRRSGIHAEKAINDLPSATLPNHATLLTGLVGDVHGLVANFDLPGRIAYPTLFDFVANAGMRSAFFASKSKLDYLAPPDVVETVRTIGELEPLVDELLTHIRSDGPDVIFVHLREPDSTGHQFGWMSSAYFDALRLSDQQVERIVSAAQSDLSRNTYFVLTADHGGDGTNHFLNIDVNRTIPWIVSGPGIAAGGVLRESVSIADTTPTILALLGVAQPTGLSGVARGVRGASSGAASSGQSLPPVGVPCLLLFMPFLLALGAASVRRRAAGETG